MQFEEYRQYDAVGLASLIQKGEVSADEVLQVALHRLDAVNPKLNVLAHDLRDKAWSWQSPTTPSPLSGVPFLLKDLIADWEGSPTWSGSRMMQDYIAPKNSALTQAYINAGLRIFGKTTTPEWGAYPVTESHVYGITRNPWHLHYTPGGSSGGSAAAVAAGIVPAAHGGDGGGSIRLPAHNCGVFGLKPSRGRSSFGPMLSESWQGMVNEHVLTRTVRDSALLLDIAAQTQAQSLYACPQANGSFFDSLQRNTGRLRIAFWQQPWLGGSNDPATQTAFTHSLKLLSDAGHDIEEASPAFSPATTLNRAARVLVMGETAKISYLYEQYTGKKLHHRQVEPTTWALITQGQQISAGEMAWARDIMLAQTHATADFFQRYDILMTPTCPSITPKIGDMMPSATEQSIIRLLFGTLKLGWLMAHNPFIEKEAQRALQYIGYTVPFNMSGNPAMSVPLFWHEGLPIGTQFIARHGGEEILLRLAAQLEQQQPWGNKYPPL